MNKPQTILRFLFAGTVLCGLGTPAPVRADAQDGEWSATFNWPEVAIHMAHLHTGQIVYWCDHDNVARVWSLPDDLEGEWFTDDVFDDEDFAELPIGANLFCSGHAAMADGTLLVAGGHVANHVGLADTYLFQQTAGTPGWEWVKVQNMAYPRWYPTCTTLPNGKILTVSGDHTFDQGTEDEDDDELVLQAIPEIFDPGFDPPAGTWTSLPGAALEIPFYPFMFVLPDGDVFYAGAESSGGHDTHAATGQHNDDGHKNSLARTGRILHRPQNHWGAKLYPSAIGGGSAVMYEPGMILKSGGGTSTATNVTEWIDLSTDVANAAWSASGKSVDDGAMHFRRRRHNLTILPDGMILATGGTAVNNDEGEAVYAAEIIDPYDDNPTWTMLAEMAIPRMYHSTAILLPDGRVLSAGGGHGQHPVDIQYEVAEIFTPPYLCKGLPRPTIASAPAHAHYSDVFQVQTPDAAQIAQVSLMRLASVTHAFDADQRRVPLDFSVGNGYVQVCTPENANFAPPGYYMLFLVSSDGVPSIATYLHLRENHGLVWVDFAYGGPEEGSFHRPFDTLVEGRDAVPTGGTVRIKSGATSETITISKAMTLEAFGGPATIGQ